MFRRSRKSSGSERHSRKKSKQDTQERKSLELAHRNELEDRRRGLVLGNTETRATKFEFTENGRSLLDHMDSHQKGSMFKYAVVSTPPAPDRQMFFDKLRTFKPKNEKTTVSLNDIPAIYMDRDFVELKFTDVISGSERKGLKDFVIISDILIYYMPMDSMFTTQFPILTCLVDDRKIESNLMRTVQMASNMVNVAIMSLDYSVAKEDLEDLALTFSCNNTMFRAGKKWGAVRVVMSYTHSDFPVRLEMSETMGCIHLSKSDLEEYDADPTKTDLLVSAEGLKQLRMRMKDGELEDLTKPSTEVKPMNVARTVLGGDIKDAPVDRTIEELKQMHLRVQRQREGIQSREDVEQDESSDGRNRPMSEGTIDIVRSDSGKMVSSRAKSPTAEDDEDEVASDADIGPLSRLVRGKKSVGFS